MSKQNYSRSPVVYGDWRAIRGVGGWIEKRFAEVVVVIV